MNGITIYQEGGGESTHNKAELRTGMETGLLKDLKEKARSRGLGLKVVFCGPRHCARDSFLSARKTKPEDRSLLLVDAEGPVDQEPLEHLRRRDGWNLKNVDDGDIHLMVQVMETWLTADPETLADFYGSGFRQGVLPQRANLEDVPKQEIEAALKSATKDTQKGEYHKIKHASALLRCVRQDFVRKRCAHCERLLANLERAIT